MQSQIASFVAAGQSKRDPEIYMCEKIKDIRQTTKALNVLVSEMSAQLLDALSGSAENQSVKRRHKHGYIEISDKL